MTKPPGPVHQLVLFMPGPVHQLVLFMPGPVHQLVLFMPGPVHQLVLFIIIMLIVTVSMLYLNAVLWEIWHKTRANAY